MKKVFFIVCLTVSLSTILSAAELTTRSRKAISYYDEAHRTYNLNERCNLLQYAINKDKKFVEAYWFYAENLVRLNRVHDALDLLQQINNDKCELRAETQFRIAEIYFNLGKYNEAIETIENINDARVIRRKTETLMRYNKARELWLNPVPFNPVNLGAVNTRFDNYFPSITADGSMISTTVLVQESPTEFQEDLYWSKKSGDKWQFSRPLLPPMNTIGNEGSQSFSADGRYMFFVACDRKDGYGGCDIYYSLRVGDEWSMPICADAPLNSQYWESNPVLSPTGDELFFVTNRPPNVGGKDIWRCKVEILDNGYLKFSHAENLGTPINTAADEFAPFIHADNQTLYFASTGHYGLGKSDIFLSRRTDNGWSEPQNIGYPINTNGEEYGFVVDAAGNRAYLSSNQIEVGVKNLNIYEIELPEQARPKPMSYVVGRVFNAQNNKLLDAYVEIFDTETSNKIYESISDKKSGEFTAYLPSEGSYGINVHRKGFLFYSDNIESHHDSLLIGLQPAVPFNKIILHNLFFAFNSSKIQEQSTKEINYLTDFMKLNSKVQIEITGHTDNVGSDAYNLQLSEQRANALRDMLIEKGIKPERIVALGKGSSEPITDNSTESGRAQNRRVEVKVIK